MNTKHTDIYIPAILFAVSHFMAGLFFEYLSCIASIIFSLYLFFLHKKKTLRIYSGPTSIALLSVIASFLLSPIWSVDKGMSVIGAFKFMPVLLFAIILMQYEKEDTDKLLDIIPLCGVIMTALSFILQFIPALHDFFVVNERLAGFFQYPNTFGFFLLLGFVITAMKSTLDIKSISILAVLTFGILQSGSRFVFGVFIVAIIAIIFTHENKKKILVPLSGLFVVVVFVAVYSVISGDYSNIGRFLTISLNSSTFVGRLIYYKDALLEIIKHPLGLGYMGYYYTQGSFQSAVYSVMFVHNEFLQLLLDAGWIPAGLCFYAFIKSAILNKNDKTKLILMLVFALHFMVDFDGQFVSILFILMLLMDIRAGKKYELKNNFAVIASTAVISLLCVFIGLSCFSQHINNPDLALKFYPLNTTAKIDLLMQADTPEEMDELAESILKQNKSVSIAYSAKAKAAFSQGDFATLIENKLRAIELAQYSIEEYKDFDYMLAIGTDLYRKAGDRESAAYCMELRNNIPDMLEALKEKTSPLAYKIDDKPVFELD